jgi:Zn-dependent protease/CBS domain-containing protein
MSTTAMPRRSQPSRRDERRPPRADFGGFRLGSLGGVEIRVDLSLAVVFALITANLGGAVFPQWHPEWSRPLSWLVALAAAVLFFASVLAHELSHAFVARARGISVKRVTLFLFGGVAHLESQPPTPKSEFLMAVVGPITSALIGVVAVGAGLALAGPSLSAGAITPEVAANSFQHAGPMATLLLWLGPVNIWLAMFNLVPGFPLDGGRIFRSIVWGITGDVVKATRWAAGAGQAFAWLLIGIGVMNLFRGAFGQGLWLLLIGWFLNNAARSSMEQLLVRRALQDVPVRRVMHTAVATVLPSLSIDQFVREQLLPSDQHAFAVEDAFGRFLGLVTFDDVRRVPQDRWTTTLVSDVMTPSARLATITSDAAAELALEELARRDVEQLPVVDGVSFLGMVRQRDLMRWLALTHAAPAR